MSEIEPIHVIGAGMAGSEAAWQAAEMGVPVVLHEMRPETGVQPRMPENRMMSSSPHQKMGME